MTPATARPLWKNISPHQFLEPEPLLPVYLRGAVLLRPDGGWRLRQDVDLPPDLEDEDGDSFPVIVPVPQEQAPPQQAGYPPGYKPNPLVEAMISQFRSREKK